MIGCNPNVGCTAFDHGQNGSQDTTYCADFLTGHIYRSRHSKKMPKQFICPVNQVHIHAAPINSLQAMLCRPASDLAGDLTLAFPGLRMFGHVFAVLGWTFGYSYHPHDLDLDWAPSAWHCRRR